MGDRVSMSSCSTVSEMIFGFPLDKVIVFDLETTGLRPYESDEVLSIGICNGYGEELFSTLIKPTRKKSWADAQKVNGISPEMVKNAPTLSEAREEIQKHLLGNRLLVGYNLKFDIPFLEKGGVFPSYPYPQFDVMEEYALIHGSEKRAYGKGYKYSKLSDCAKSYGHKFDAHNATADAIATAQCFRALICDEAFLGKAVKEILQRLRTVSTSQLKDTNGNVVDMVNKGVVTSMKAELRIGEVTRGKNKGAKRYECYIDELCVGVCPTQETGKISELYALSEKDDFPASVPCKATLSASGDKGKCEIEVTAHGKFKNVVFSAAEQARATEMMEYRDAVNRGRGQTAPSSKADAEPLAPTSANPASPKSAEKGKTPIPWIILSVFLALCAISSFGVEGDAAIKAITFLVFAICAFASLRKAAKLKK